MIPTSNSASKTPKQLREHFLENNPKYHPNNVNTSSIGDFYNISEDDEVWIMQCPKGTDLSVLKNSKLKLPGRSNQDDLETVAVEYPQPIPHAFGHQNRKGHNNIKIVPIQGSIILRNRLKAIALPEENESETKSGRVPMPKGVKERHPLHGVDYESKVKIDPKIEERLKLADQICVRPLPVKSKRKSTKIATINLDSDSEVEIVTKKKAKKKKHSKADNEEIVSHSPAKKKKRNSLGDDVAEDLQWIQKL